MLRGCVKHASRFCVKIASRISEKNVAPFSAEVDQENCYRMKGYIKYISAFPIFIFSCLHFIFVLLRASLAPFLETSYFCSQFDIGFCKSTFCQK